MDGEVVSAIHEVSPGSELLQSITWSPGSAVGYVSKLTTLYPAMPAQ